MLQRSNDIYLNTDKSACLYSIKKVHIFIIIDRNSMLCCRCVYLFINIALFLNCVLAYTKSRRFNANELYYNYWFLLLVSHCMYTLGSLYFVITVYWPDIFRFPSADFQTTYFKHCVPTLLCLICQVINIKHMPTLFIYYLCG